MEKKIFHVDWINGSYGEYEDYKTDYASHYYPVTLSKEQFELLKKLKFNANRTNNRNMNLAVALAFIEAIDELVKQIKEVHHDL